MNDLLIDAIRERAADASRATDSTDVIPAKVFPVARPDQIAKAERDLGFPLPALLKELYLLVGNGGYGPGYGLIGVSGGAGDDLGKNVEGLYAEFTQVDPDDPHWHWPPRLLPIANLGCAMYACVDCSTPEGRVVWFEPNPHEPEEPWDDSFIPLAPSMAHWLRSWLAGEDLFENAWKTTFGE